MKTFKFKKSDFINKIIEHQENPQGNVVCINNFNDAFNILCEKSSCVDIENINDITSFYKMSDVINDIFDGANVSVFLAGNNIEAYAVFRDLMNAAANATPMVFISSSIDSDPEYFIIYKIYDHFFGFVCTIYKPCEIIIKKCIVNSD